MDIEILIIDDDKEIGRQIAGLLKEEGYRPRVAFSLATALDEISKRMPSLILLDVWLQGCEMDGLSFLRQLKRLTPQLPTIMMSGHGTLEMAVAAVREGASDFLEKPFQTDRLLLSIKHALEKKQLLNEIQQLKNAPPTFSPFCGPSSAMQSLSSLVRKVAPTNTRVLIQGEHSVGKKSLAREIHNLSKKSSGPFIYVPCSKIEPSEVELFFLGQEEALSRIPSPLGVLESAHGGTLVLDKIEHLPSAFQIKLARILHEQKFHRLGGAQPIDINVRFLTLAHPFLQDKVERGLVSRDLYERLNVFSMIIPPLRDRREDIPSLIQSTVTYLEKNLLFMAAKPLSPALISTLQCYDWPGNMREFRNLLELLLVAAQNRPEETIDVDLLPREFLIPSNEDSLPTTKRSSSAFSFLSLPLKRAREVFEKEYLEAQVNRFSGNVTQTADFIGMERSALHRKLKTLSLPKAKKSKNK